ncbi:MAG: hypothetical protein ABS44_07325 [Chryseobacterium sp. SCN 40-13]|nr:MAG: hypothetical protein ABS44_07325 [Chryseobacterium sp. SCN 40-13]
MKKIYFLSTFFVFNVFFSQTNYVLKMKFNEKHFLSSFIRNNTKNEFVLNAFRKADSVIQKSPNSDYLNVLDTVLKDEFKISIKEKNNFSDLEKKQYDSLSLEMQNGNLLNLFKKAIQVNYNSEFLETILLDSAINDFKIITKDYNQFSISFANKVELKKAKIIFHKNRLSFHDAIEENELEVIQNCFIKENYKMFENNYLKKEKNYLLVYKDFTQLFEKSYQQSKCLDTKKTIFLLDNGKDFDVYSKLFFVSESSNSEKNLVNSITGFNISFKQNKEIYKDNYFYLSIFTDDQGKEIFSNISEQNIGKKIFIADNSEFISNLNISSKIRNGIFISGNLFEENWQKLFELVKFETFRNSLTID